jgi:hypothetical protein
VTCRFAAALVFAGVLGTGQIAAAQDALVRHIKHPKAERHGARPARPIPIPQQVAPPQEAFASFPEKAAGPPSAPTACDLELGKVATFRPLGMLVAPGECGAPDAVLLESVVLPDRTKVALMPPATLRCRLAGVVAQWLRDDVAPATAKLGAPLRALENLGSYECRGRDRVRGATLSEHGRANALDVHAFRLANGKNFVLADPKAPKDWRDAIRASACARFSTVLGPGSDAEHAEHIHLDLAERRNHYKLCEWDVRVPPPPPSAALGTTPIPIDEVPLPTPRPVVASVPVAGPRMRRSRSRY